MMFDTESSAAETERRLTWWGGLVTGLVAGAIIATVFWMLVLGGMPIDPIGA